MSAYTTLYDTDAENLFVSSPSAGTFLAEYDLFKQMAVALYTEATLILSDPASTAAQLAIAQAIGSNPVAYAHRLMAAFAADSAVLGAAGAANPPTINTATDAQMQAAAHWIIPALVP